MSLLPGRFQPKTLRRAENPVSHEIEYTLLTPERLAYERIAAYVDRERLKLSSGQCERLAEMLVTLGLEQRRHCDGAELVQLRSLVLALGERLTICAGLLSRCAERRDAK